MDFIVTLLVGALIGWLASIIMKTDAEQGALMNIIVGVVGAFLGRLVFSDLLGIGSAATAGSFSLGGILWGVVGAVILLGAMRMFRRHA